LAGTSYRDGYQTIRSFGRLRRRYCTDFPVRHGRRERGPYVRPCGAV
jgi:hypothetical protein